MKSLWLILFVLLGGMSAMYSRFKRILAETEGRQDEYEPQPFFNDEDEPETKFEGEGSFTNDYFSYETSTEPVKVSKETEMQVITEEAPASQLAFDLRQAVVYQTILNNRYINLEN